MASADCTVLKVTMGHKLYSYLERKPQNYDVSFSVGPQKIIVKAQNVNADRLHFPTNNRISVGSSLIPKDWLSLSLATKFDMDTDSSVDLDGKERWISIVPGSKIVVYGLSFLGPMNNDVSYKVSVRITRTKSMKETDEILGQVTQQISAAKNRQFYFLFDEPVILGPLPSNRNWTYWTDYYRCYYTLTAEGQKVSPQGLKTDGRVFQVQVGSNESVFCTEGKHLMEILFKNI